MHILTGSEKLKETMRKKLVDYGGAYLPNTKMRSAILVFLSLGIVGLPSFGKESAPNRGDVCVFPAPPPDFIAYMHQMRERFYRNLPTLALSPENVVIRFFLTSDGVVRDAVIEKSCGNETSDLACLDAVCSASPLPTPPLWRGPLPPASDSKLLPPNYSGTGVYSFTFSKNEKPILAPAYPMPVAPPRTSQNFEYELVPKEVLFRYPGVFTRNDLESASNKRLISAYPELLQTLRFQWSKFFTENQHASREQILEWSSLITDMYLPKK